MCCYRKILKVRWIHKVSNDEILTRVGEKKNFWQNIVKQRVELIGHIKRHKNLLKTIIEGYIEGKRGRPRLQI